MARSKPPCQLSPTDAAYLAGLVDGEGTISLTRRHARDQRQLVMSVANTEKQILDWILTRTGVGKITRKRISQQHHTPSYTYSVGNRQALDLLEQIAPFLQSCKKERAELVLDAYVRLTPRNGRYSPSQQAEREEFINRFMAISSRGRRNSMQ
jgi:hypothetical protein